MKKPRRRAKAHQRAKTKAKTTAPRRRVTVFKVQPVRTFGGVALDMREAVFRAFGDLDKAKP